MELRVQFVNAKAGERTSVFANSDQPGSPRLPAPTSAIGSKLLKPPCTDLRKQHLWDAISDEAFKAEYQALQRQRRALEPKLSQHPTPNFDRAAELLRDLPSLWEHPGVTQEQRRELTKEVFDEIRIREGKLVAVKPRPDYAPLFAYSIWKANQEVGGDCSTWARRTTRSARTNHHGGGLRQAQDQR